MVGVDFIYCIGIVLEMYGGMVLENVVNKFRFKILCKKLDE